MALFEKTTRDHGKNELDVGTQSPSVVPSAALTIDDAKGKWDTNDRTRDATETVLIDNEIIRFSKNKNV